MPDNPVPLADSRDVVLARLDEKMTRVLDDLKEMKASAITRAEFKPVQLITFGLVGIIIAAVLYALLANVGLNK